MSGGMPMPGPLPTSSQNMSMAPSVTVGDNVVNISMLPTSSPAQVAGKVGEELQSNRDAILSPYPGS
jgi:hypothetical protein